jgi:hypothetical protein
MFADQINAAIAATAEPRALDMLARSIWQAHGSGALDDAGASAALEALQCRRSATRPQTPPPSKRAPRASARRQRSPDRQASIERRRRLAASGPMPPAMAANFTGGELSALRIVGDEVRVHGCCALHLDAIAARAGTCRTTVKNALRQARALGLVTIHERRRRGQPSLTNIIKIVSAEWRTWLSKGGGGKKLPTADIAKQEPNPNRGFGGNWERYYRHYRPERKSDGA